MNDILSITVQENFDNDVTAAWSLGSSNFCRAHQQNGLSCSMEAGPQQGLGKIVLLDQDYEINSGFFKCSNSSKVLPPLDFNDAFEFCADSGSNIGWISLSDAKKHARNIIVGNITGYQAKPPFIFWTGIIRVDSLYFQNDSQIIQLDQFPETDFWTTTVSDKDAEIYELSTIIDV